MILQFYCKTITDGKKDKGVSETGVKFYNDLIKELIANGQNNSNHISSLFFTFKHVAKLPLFMQV